jgi:hypothetical protein
MGPIATIYEAFGRYGLGFAQEEPNMATGDTASARLLLAAATKGTSLDNISH